MVKHWQRYLDVVLRNLVYLFTPPNNIISLEKCCKTWKRFIGLQSWISACKLCKACHSAFHFVVESPSIQKFQKPLPHTAPTLSGKGSPHISVGLAIYVLSSDEIWWTTVQITFDSDLLSKCHKIWTWSPRTSESIKKARKPASRHHAGSHRVSA